MTLRFTDRDGRARSWLEPMAVFGALLFALACFAFAIGASAQTNPLTLPRVDASGVTLAGSWQYDWPDGAGGDISWGGPAAGVSEDGNRFFVACNITNARKGIAALTIPALGAVATVAAPCQGPDRAEIEKLVPGWGAGQQTLGGVLEQGGRVVVTGFGSYDANGAATASHWVGASLTTLTGPYRGTVAPGMVHSQMGVIPSEWQALLGGTAFSTAGYTSITSRSSQGPAFTVFSPAAVAANFPMQMLLGCPYSVAACASRWTSFGPSTDEFDGSELAAGAFIVPGTRTLVYIEREGVGGECYGYATTDKSLHGTPYPSPEGVRWCYAPYDQPGQKGNKAQSYRLVAKLYDLTDLVAVKAGTRQPWDVRPYAVVTLPGSQPGQRVEAGAYNPVRGEFYLLTHIGGGRNTVQVYRGWGSAGVPPPPPPPPPADVDCAGNWAGWVRVSGSETACTLVAGQPERTFTEHNLFTVTQAPSGNGAACPASPQTRTSTEGCTLPPPDLDVTCWVTGQGTSYADGDRRPVIRCDTNGPATLVIGQTFTLKKQ